jgi:hypothetical protein
MFGVTNGQEKQGQYADPGANRRDKTECLVE